MRMLNVRVALAYAGSVGLFALSGWLAWSLFSPITEIPATGDIAAITCGTIVVFSAGGGVLSGAVFHLLARPQQLRLAYFFALAVAALSVGVDAIAQQGRPGNHTAFAFTALWALPFLVATLAATGISQYASNNK
jgi:hypothetical protein